MEISDVGDDQLLLEARRHGLGLNHFDVRADADGDARACGRERLLRDVHVLLRDFLALDRADETQIRLPHLRLERDDALLQADVGDLPVDLASRARRRAPDRS